MICIKNKALNFDKFSRVTKRLKEKSGKEKQLEKKEQGFTTYVNGAHQEAQEKTPTKLQKSSKRLL